MGFENDFDFNDDFETDIPDPDSVGFAEKPKKLSRKELREAKKKTAEKAAELPKQKKSFFSRHERMDDNDEALSGEHMFDPTRTAMVSTPHDRSRDFNDAPIRNTNSEFSYLFDPAGDDESDDDVYPEQSIYSDPDTAKDILAGLAYDESRDGDSGAFDQYFDDQANMRPPSRFSFKKHGKDKDKANDDWNDLGDLDVEEEEPPRPAPIKVVPKKAAPPEEKPDSYLPELRPDSVFIAPEQRKDPPPEPPRPVVTPTYDDVDESEEDYMSNNTDKPGQEFLPYGGMMPSYPMNPMNPMNPMMSYPVVIPSGQNQGGGMPYQTIPIPYPMPMPMPMPMYNQYPQYPYPPQYPSYPPQSDYYGRPYDDRREPRRDDRRESRRGDRRDDRYYDERRDDRYYDDRRRDRYDDRYYDRRDERDDRYYDDRRTYPRPPYEPPYPREEKLYPGESQPAPMPAAPIYTAPQPPVQVTPEPVVVQPAPVYTPPAPQPEPIAVTPEPMRASENPFGGFDFTFHKPEVDKSVPADNSAPFSGDPFGTPVGGDSFADGFDDDLDGGLDDGFDDNSGGDFASNLGSFDEFGFNAASNTEEDDFGLGLGGRSITPPSAAGSFTAEEGKPKGGRFKKR